MMSKPGCLTAERLRELLAYDPETGIFTWKTTMGSRAVAGQQTDSLDDHGYVRIRVDKRLYRAHRLAVLYMSGSFPPADVDHINLNRADNRWKNLRNATRTVNARNTNLRSDSTSGLKNVSWHKATGKWQVNLAAGGKNIHIGLFADKELAAQAAAEARSKYHSPFERKGATI